MASCDLCRNRIDRQGRFDRIIATSFGTHPIQGVNMQFTVEYDDEIQEFILHCASEMIILRSKTFDEAVVEAQEIAQEWA